MELTVVLIQTLFCMLHYKRRNNVLSTLSLCVLMFLPTTVLADRSAFVDLEGADKHTEQTTKERSIRFIKGTFSTAGSVKTTQGQVVSLSEDDDCGSQDDKDMQGKPKGDWIAVLHYPRHSHRFETNDSDCNTILDRVKKAMLFGASAILILALNPKVIKELDVPQLFSYPIVYIQDVENITAILGAIASQIKLTLKITYNTSFYDLQKISTLTLWSTCGRSSGVSAYNEWEGVVCLEAKDTKGKVNPVWHYLVSGVFLLLLLMIMKNNRDDGDDHLDNSECILRHLAYQVMGQMQCYRYQSAQHLDTCAVCLDNYYLKQLIRELPCGHRFHAKCVDVWLIAQRTCPLCKQNILDFYKSAE